VVLFFSSLLFHFLFLCIQQTILLTLRHYPKKVNFSSTLVLCCQSWTIPKLTFVRKHSRFQTSILLQELFFSRSFIFVPSSPRHHFFTALSFFFTPRRQTNERTSKRTTEQTNDRAVTLSFSRHVHLLLAITNFLSFASFLFLLTLDRPRR
jgi:hypothetical protein